MMASHTSNSMEIDQFPHPASTNNSRRFENILPPIGAVFKDLPPLLSNNPTPPFIGSLESESRISGSLPAKRVPSDSDRWHWGVPRQQYRTIQHEHPGHNHHHSQLGGGGVVKNGGGGRGGVLLNSINLLSPLKPSGCGGNTRDPEYLYGTGRAVISSPSPSLPGAATSSHVKQQQQQQQRQQQQTHYQPPPPPPPPPPPQPLLRPPSNTTWTNNSNNNRPERPSSPQLSPTEGYLQDYSVNDSDAATEKYSENGDSDITSSVHGDTFSHTGSIRLPYARQFLCGKCKSAFKCDSLRRKHEMKHTKPFKCEVLGCKRIAGFSSVNDRNRHMNSVHRRHISGPAVGYDCQYDHCRDNGKIFFRLDNFRNHLKKKHGPKGTQEELEEFLKRAETECRRTQHTDFIPPCPPSPNQSMDTRSEPGFSDVPSTPIATDSPGLPPISPTFRRAPREAFHSPVPPPVPGFPAIPDPSFGHGKLAPLAPKNRVPEAVDASSDDRMDLDYEEPMTRVYKPSGAKPNGGPGTNPTANPEAKDRGSEVSISNKRSVDRKRRIDEISRLIEALTSEKENLVYEQQVELDRNPYSGQLHGQRAIQDPRIPVSGPNGPNPKRVTLGKKDLDHDMQRGEEPSVLADPGGSSTSHALRGYIQQETTQDPFPGRLLDPRTDPQSPDAADKDRACALSPQGTMTVSSPTGTTAATEVSQQQHPTEIRPRPTGPQAQRRPLPTRQTGSKYAGNAQSRHGPGPGSGFQKGPAICSVCSKTFHRPSELKKHMKRHSRPFACTFRGCGKSFGSKNDWKRHENSQHFQLELWKCGVIAPKSTSLCGKLSFRRESHITHLKNAHNIIDKTEIQKWTNDAHIGRNNFRTFWCGFCSRDGVKAKGRVVQLKKKGLDGWDERFDHLGKHFEEGNLIKDYQFHEEDVFGEVQSTEEEDEEEEDGDGDDIRDEGEDTGGCEKPVIESTAPPEDSKAEELQPSQVPAPKHERSGKKMCRWYCCKHEEGKCADPGPYTVGLSESCIECCHERCRNCIIEVEGRVQ